MAKELYNEVSVAETIAPLIRTATVEGSTVDLKGYESALFVLHVGTITDGTHTLEIQDSPDDSTWTAVADANMEGPTTLEPAWTSALDDRILQVAYVGSARYVRAVVTVTGSPSTGGTIGGVVVRGHARHNQAGGTQAP